MVETPSLNDWTDVAEDERDWRDMAAQAFFVGYAEGDSVYDNYDQIHGW
jgi:hypothetical protein